MSNEANSELKVSAESLETAEKMAKEQMKALELDIVSFELLSIDHADGLNEYNFSFTHTIGLNMERRVFDPRNF